MTSTETVELLKHAPLFSALSQEELLKLDALITEHHFSAGDAILWEGDRPDWFYIVKEGRVKIVKYTSSGKELIVAVFTPPGIFGEIAVFDGRPYPASATALEDTTLLAIKRDDFLAFLSQNPSVALKIINMLGARLRDAHDRLRDMSGERVEQRIANMLLMLSARLGSRIPFTRQEIAGMTGITTETVIRTTTRMKEMGVINTARGAIVIADEGKLRLLSEGSMPV